MKDLTASLGEENMSKTWNQQAETVFITKQEELGGNWLMFKNRVCDETPKMEKKINSTSTLLKKETEKPTWQIILKVFRLRKLQLKKHRSKSSRERKWSDWTLSRERNGVSEEIICPSLLGAREGKCRSKWQAEHVIKRWRPSESKSKTLEKSWKASLVLLQTKLFLLN